MSRLQSDLIHENVLTFTMNQNKNRNVGHCCLLVLLLVGGGALLSRYVGMLTNKDKNLGGESLKSS